jgi:hypothetical protein
MHLFDVIGHRRTLAPEPIRRKFCQFVLAVLAQMPQPGAEVLTLRASTAPLYGR